MNISTWNQTFSTGRTPSHFAYFYAKVSVWKWFVAVLACAVVTLSPDLRYPTAQSYHGDLGNTTSRVPQQDHVGVGKFPLPGCTCVPCWGREQKAWMVLLQCNPSFLSLVFSSLFIFLCYIFFFCFFLLIYFSWLVGSVCGRNALASLASKIGGISFRLDQSHIYLHPWPLEITCWLIDLTVMVCSPWENIEHYNELDSSLFY